MAALTRPLVEAAAQVDKAQTPVLPARLQQQVLAALVFNRQLRVQAFITVVVVGADLTERLLLEMGVMVVAVVVHQARGLLEPEEAGVVPMERLAALVEPALRTRVVEAVADAKTDRKKQAVMAVQV